MKEKMKKLSILLFHQDKEQALGELQNLGVIHLETEFPEGNEKVDALIEKKQSIEKAIEILSLPGRQADTKAKKPGDVQQGLTAVLELNNKVEELAHKKETLLKEIEALKPWGQFSWDAIHTLQEKGIKISFYTASKRDFRKFDFGSLAVEVISETNSQYYFVVFSRDEVVDLPFELILLPARAISDISILREIQAEIDHAAHQIANYKHYLPAFENERLAVLDQLQNQVADCNMRSLAEGSILQITGWFPQSQEAVISEFLTKNQIAFEVSVPQKGDNVPVILRNRKYSKIFESITRIFQLPDYHEFDLTPMIAVFYPVFFAYCLGDSGYGLVVFLAAFIGYFTFFKNSRNIALLGIVLGLVTMVIGIVKSGTVFGIPVLENTDIAFFDFLSRFVFVPDSQEFVFNAFNVALMIGLLQIITAVIISIWRKVVFDGWMYSLYDVGKLMIIIGTVSFFLGSMQGVELFIPYVPAAKILILIGVIVVLVFHDLDQKFLARMGSGVLPLYFIFTGLMGDALSYIRLFALGVASAILGLVVNQIGGQILESGKIHSIIIGILFLIIGHSLNLALACLGSFVHPLRLTFVEFYNNAGFKGGGIEYKPFKKESYTEN